MNAFLDYADRNTPSPIKARQRAAEKRAETLDRKKTDDDAGLREWKRWRQEEVREALAGPHGAQLAALIADLKAAPSWDAINPDAIAAAWSPVDRDTRALVTRVVNAFVIRLRKDAGLPPFDDELPF